MQKNAKKKKISSAYENLRKGKNKDSNESSSKTKRGNGLNKKLRIKSRETTRRG